MAAEKKKAKARRVIGQRWSGILPDQSGGGTDIIALHYDSS